MIEVLPGDKPIDLHPNGPMADHRIYECASCGDRFDYRQVNDLGGLCPKDGAVFRPLGRFETRHSEFRKNWLRGNRAA